MPKKITLEDVGRFYNDEIIQHNDNTKVLNIPHRNYNQALQRKFQRGAKQNAAWDKDHPVAAKWRNVATTIPFAIAAAPFATAAINAGKVIRTIPKVAKTINTIAKSPVGKIISKAKPYINGTLALSGITHGVNEIKNTGFTPQAALDLSLAYPALKNILPKITYTPIKGYNIENKTNIKGYLPFNENKKPNYGSYIRIPSTGQIIPLTDENDISDYAKSKGLIPTKQRSLLFGDVVDPINRTRFSLQEPQQHFVFEGPVGEKGLNIVRKYSKEELDPLPYTARGHRGAWGQNLSRKVKKYGGIKI